MYTTVYSMSDCLTRIIKHKIKVTQLKANNRQLAKKTRKEERENRVFSGWRLYKERLVLGLGPSHLGFEKRVGVLKHSREHTTETKLPPHLLFSYSLSALLGFFITPHEQQQGSVEHVRSRRRFTRSHRRYNLYKTLSLLLCILLF